jgi:glycosyltransferase involved in cell wall biosynthesis
VRIVQVAPFFHPHAGGVESHVRSLCTEFARRGHDVTVVTSRFRPGLPPEESAPEGYRIVRTRALGVWFNTPVDIGTGQALRGLDADVFHLHYPPPLTSFLASWSLDGRAVPICLTYHCDLFLAGAAGRLLSRMYERTLLPPTLRRVDRIVVHTRSYGTTSAVLRGHELAIIPSVVDLDRFRPGLDGSRARAELGLEGRRVVVFTGRLVPHKGVDVLVRALTHLPSDVHVVVIGRGPRLVSLAGLARRAGVAGRVHFCPGVSDDELPSYLDLADVFAFPSQNRLEGFGLAVAEAMACGLPVVTSDMPGVREVIEDGVHGRLAQPLLAEDFAEKLRELLDDPALARRMGAAGRRRAEERYSLRTVGAELIRLYESLNAAD